MIRQNEMNITLSKNDIYIILNELDNSYNADGEFLEGQEELQETDESHMDYLERIRNQMKENRRVADAIQQELNDNTVFCMVRWSDEDIVDMLETCGIETTEENIEKIRRKSRVLEERGVEDGYETLKIVVECTFEEEKDESSKYKNI